MVESVRLVYIHASLLILLCLATTLGVTSLVQAKTIDGVGKLKFGMQPTEVESLDGCSSETECLYEILGKNRYFTLVYGGNGASNTMSSQTLPSAKLTHIDIDMGNHTNEWFTELYEVMIRQYPLIYLPTEEEKIQFEDGMNKELTIGFANGSVLLKLVRRQFGNIILRVVYQNLEAAEAQVELWKRNSSQPATQ